MLAPIIATAASDAVAAPNAAIQITATTTAASNQLTAISSMAGLAVGQEITGVGIIAGTTIAAINAGASSLTLSQNASFSNTTPVQAFPLGKPGIVPASPARSRSRTVLAADGQYRIPESRYLYKFDDARRLRRFRAARAEVLYSQSPIATNVANRGRNVIVHSDSGFAGNEPEIANWRISPGAAAWEAMNGIYKDDKFRYGSIQENGNFPGVDPRYTLGSSWEGGQPFPGLPGFMIDNGGTTNLTIADTLPWNTMDIYFLDLAFSFTYSLDGAPAVTVNNTTNTQAVKKMTITAASVGLHTLIINRVSGLPRFFMFNAYESARHQMRFVNMASGGGGAAALANVNAALNPAAIKALFDPALVIINYGYDVPSARSSPGTPAATMVANWVTAMNSIIAAYKAQNINVVLMTAWPWDDVDLYKDQATVAQMREASYLVADTQDVPLIDCYAYWGTWSEANAAGFLQHYYRVKPAGGWDLGLLLARALSSI